jgi:pyrimidine-nucleoside phosphorylase/thymidine phosphorylase
MRAVDIIEKKRWGGEHSRAELEHLVLGYVQGEIPDYQVSAWLMAICFQGMTPQETAELTEVMAASGEAIDLAGLPHTVDKHSTGGVGDKTSIVLAPLLGACGATAAKMSGRGLGHTGGTIDKLEAVPGYKADLDEEAFLAQAREVGVVLVGQSRALAPADGALYALRDATATVQSLPLIASSIMSKKLASGAKSIALDVKVGSGAFMKTLDEARALARAMIDIGTRAGRNVRAVLSAMDEPLGRAVGNALEVEEAAACLQGRGPRDLRELCVTLAYEVLQASGLKLAREAIAAKLDSGEAYAKLEQWLSAQGGDASRLGRLELAPDRYEIEAERSGYLSRCDALAVGRAVGVLGGGRKHKGDEIDLGVGAMLHAKVGDEVRAGEPLVTLYHRAGRGLGEAVALLKEALVVSEAPVERQPLVYEVLR